jgi:Flp pilus assembly protein TadG
MGGTAHSGRGGARRKERGATAIEGPLAILPLLAFMFAVVDLGIAVFVKNTVQFAVCQGVRYAVTSQTMNGLGQDASIKAVVQGYTIGFLDYMSPDHTGANRISISYYDPASLTPVTGTGSNIGGNIVVVTASGLSWAWMVPLLRSVSPLTFSVASADIMEATPVAGAPAR